jgi:U4/U6.U5 tri-snRNP-associated protein 2
VQGRGITTQAYFHALHHDHHVFIHLQTLQVYVLPDGYAVSHPSLEDIKYVVYPTFTPSQVAKLDHDVMVHMDLNHKRYIPGFVGLNNIKANDYVNVVVHAFARVAMLRDFFLLNDLRNKYTPLVEAYGLLMRKMWNPKAFKGHVSPHEFIQQVMSASNKRFIPTKQSDPVEFIAWLLNKMHVDLCTTTKRKSSMVSKAFQGQVRIESQNIGIIVSKDHVHFMDTTRDITVRHVPFMYLGLDLPATPLFQDEIEGGSIIPQVPMDTLLSKYDGLTVQESQGIVRRYKILKLPPYLILHIKRFSKNNWTTEKNPTIVNYNMDCLDLSPYVDTLAQYKLVANICHQGTLESGTYKVQVRALDQWYSIEDLYMEPILAPMVPLSETTIQVWQRFN